MQPYMAYRKNWENGTTSNFVIFSKINTFVFKF
jgi:hypothetical protein